jgi:small glutamine-rich tetratricopeptide repeat-containing protein alpha
MQRWIPDEQRSCPVKSAPLALISPLQSPPRGLFSTQPFTRKKAGSQIKGSNVLNNGFLIDYIFLWTPKTKNWHLPFATISSSPSLRKTSAVIRSRVLRVSCSYAVAIDCISSAFEINLSDPSLSIKPANLASIFDVFLNTQQKMAQSSVKKDSAKAEDLKNQGNAKMSSKEYPAAIALYTQAIALNETPIYLSNRAAAYSQQGNHQLAVQDATRAIDLDPKYTKAYSRLGHAFFGLGKYAEAVKAYENGLVVEPGNSAMIQALASAKEKSTRSAVSPAAGASGGQGGFDLASMMSNPEFMNMATSMMQNNPNLAKMMDNPAVKSMLSNPSALSEMMNNPAVKSMMNNPAAMSQMMNNPDIASLAGQVAENPDSLKNILDSPDFKKMSENMKK